MFNKRSSILGIILGLVAILAIPASANTLQSATATANCQGYTLTAVAGDLVKNKTYTIDYNFTLTCNGGAPVIVPGTITFTAAANTPPTTVTASGTFAGLAGSTCVVTGTAALMVENDKQIPIVINGGKSASLTCSLPTASCVAIVAEQGVPITPVTLTGSGGAGGPYTFSATGLPPGLSISTSGTISGTPTASGTYPYTVTIKDNAGNTGTINCSVTVAPPPSLTCAAANSGEVGVPFSSGAITVTGGTSPYTFSIVGTLPAGLTLNTSTGAITGTPTAAGTFSIQVTDSLGAVALGACPITIIAGPQVTCSATATSGEVGTAFNSPAVTVTGGTSPYTFSIVGTLPAGLTLNTSTGAVTGTPTAAGSFSIQVKDANGVVGNATCPVTIIAGPQVTCSATATSGEVGTAFNSPAVTVTGGTSPYTFSIVGTLPAGLTLNTATGAVTGTPTAAGSFSIQVKDANGVVGNATCPITIGSMPQVTCSATSAGQTGVAFNSGAITVTGGTSPYTFSIVGTLPAGLTLNTSTGAVTGTPTAAGTFSIQVTDAEGVAGKGSCSITISTPPCLTSQLGSAAGLSVLGLQGANVQLGGQLTLKGSVGIGAGGKIGVTSGDNFPGTLFADPTAAVTIASGSGFAGGVTTESMSAIQSAALAEAASVGSLTATQTLSQITTATTITGNGGQNVIMVNGSVNLPSGKNLTISGGANDTFVFNITGGFTLNNANIVLNGVAANQVLFYFPGSGSAIQTNNASLAGIFLAPNRNISIMGGTHTGEFISGGTISIASCGSNTTVNLLPVCSPEQMALTCPANSGIVGTPYASELTATGGESPYTFSITGGNLPAGLTLNTSNGDITGTPTAANPYGFTAKVVDSSGLSLDTASSSCTVTVTTNPYVCTIPPSSSQCGGSGVKWNSFKPQGSTSVVWVNLHIGTPTGISTSAVTTIQFTNVVLTVSGKTYPLPDGFLTFDPAAPSTPTTTFDSTYAPNGRWITTVNPSHLSDQIFFDGQAIPVDSTIAAGGTASISFTTESTDNTMSFGWQWGAAAYSSWPGNNQANVLPYHGNVNAGSPQSSQVQQSQISGPDDPSSGCHSSNNYTGQFSQTLYAACTASCTPSQITPYIQVDGQSWQEANTVTISGCNHNVNLGPQPISGGSWSWTGPQGYTSTSRQINNIPLVTGTNTFVATYTNPSGCQSQQTFTITVK